jgi:hypothetical protein
MPALRIIYVYDVKCCHCTCSYKVIGLCEEPGGWDYEAGKKQATWRYAIRQALAALLITFSSHLCVVARSEMKYVDEVLSSCKCKCVYANSKLHERSLVTMPQTRSISTYIKYYI